MNIQAWRIIKEKYSAAAFSGEGASRTGGRWNSRGVWMVYTSATLSLAALENLVHLNPPVRFRYAAFRVEFDRALVERTASASLPADWTVAPPPPSTQALGDRWSKEARSAILEVPSVIVPVESNFLFNPRHPDFQKITIGKPGLFAFDPRLLA